MVDNCPMQPQHEELKSAFADEEIVRIVSEPQKGISAARNTALKLSRAPIVCFIDDDALAHPNWLSELLTAFRSYGDNVGIVGGSYHRSGKALFLTGSKNGTLVTSPLLIGAGRHASQIRMNGSQMQHRI